ncbi:MAG TPA: 4Fe-4S dicluster domain-containing protein [Thermoplasmata archaeon]|jgi:sulfhydrogenase subunit beta (sulfur reductase)|nr:4Fe-4S dicluster domain-containing protein [Thermoplasmata archaeon]
MVELGIGDRRRLDRADFPRLLSALSASGYRVVGPTLRDGAIVYGDIATEDDLPIGWTDRQEAGRYRVERRDDGALFGYNVGPHSWKKYLFPARERLWTATRKDGSFEVTGEPLDGPPLAFLGMRACELAGLDVTDRVFDGAVRDPSYHARRARVLRIAVQCGQAGATCFCTSMGTGPEVTRGFDLKLTELLAPGPHRFVVEIGSAEGARVVADLPLAPAPEEDRTIENEQIRQVRASMGRRMDVDGIHDLLLGQPDHPRWEIVARRCLSCTNCTMVCPTCFCHTTEEVPDLSGDRVERWRRWDSCFNLEFTALHGNSVRKSGQSRYRQWLTHKLAGWYDQFDSSGCIGCGRCITWCPVGIDITEEVAALRVVPAKPAGAP